MTACWRTTAAEKRTRQKSREEEMDRGVKSMKRKKVLFALLRGCSWG
jgi:hypothetical protein